MMKQYIFTLLFTLAGLAGMAQTNEPLPGDAEPLTNQLYLSPSDSTVWAADPFSGLAIKVGTWFKVDSLFGLGYTKAQVDSAIAANIPAAQTLSLGTSAGNLIISGGNNVSLSSLSEGVNVSESWADWANGSVIGFRPFTSGIGATGLPVNNNGTGIFMKRNAGLNTVSSFALYKPYSATDKLYYLAGISTTAGIYATRTFASEEWVASNYFNRTQVDSAITVNISFHNVKSFGAVGDGVTDDTEAIQDAMDYLKSSGDGRMFFPQGEYMISSTVYFPSNVELFGEGKEKSVIRNLPTASPDTVVVIDLGIPEDQAVRHFTMFRPMFSTETASYLTFPDTTKNVVISDMGFDWNGVSSEQYSGTEILIGRALDVRVERVRLFDLLPSNLNNTGTRRRGSNIQFAFAWDCSISESQIGAADYESVSVRFLSKNIRVFNNIFDINKPSTFAGQSHCIQVASPPIAEAAMDLLYGEHTSGPLFIEDNSFFMRSGVGHAATSHSGSQLHVTGNYVKSFGTATHGFKVMDSNEIFFCVNNILDFTESNGITPNIIGLNDQAQVYSPTQYSVVSGNIIKVNLEGVTNFYPIIGSKLPTNLANNTAITGNIISIDGYDNVNIPAIFVNGFNNSVANNQIMYSNPSESINGSGPIAISVDADNTTVLGNNVYGTSIAIGLKAVGSNIQHSVNNFTNAITPVDE